MYYTWNVKAQAWSRLHSMYKVCYKRVYPKILGIGWKGHNYVVERCYRMLQHKLQIVLQSQPLFQVLTHQYSKFLDKLFCSILYTYCEVHFMLVPQHFMCNTSVTRVNWWINDWIFFDWKSQFHVCLYQFWLLCSKLFCTILYTYYGVCSIPVPQHFMCHASVTGVDTVHIPNCVLYSQFKRMCCKLFWPIFNTHRTIGYHQY